MNMIDQNFLKNHNFTNDQIKAMTEDEYAIIRNFFNVPEINKMRPKQVLEAVKILLPILNKVEIVDMQLYMKNLRKEVEIVEPKTALEDFEEKSIISTNRKDPNQSMVDAAQQEFDRILDGKYFVEQVWILEHLVNNPNLFMKGEKAEAIKNKLKEKELELSIHNTLLKLFIEHYDNTNKITLLLNMRHFAPLKEILEFRKQLLLRRQPINFRGLIEVFVEFGFEETQVLNEGMCRILAKIINNQKLEKLLHYAVEHFGEVKLATEKRKVIAKMFK